MSVRSSHHFLPYFDTIRMIHKAMETGVSLERVGSAHGCDVEARVISRAGANPRKLTVSKNDKSKHNSTSGE